MPAEAIEFAADLTTCDDDKKRKDDDKDNIQLTWFAIEDPHAACGRVASTTQPPATIDETTQSRQN